MRGSGGHGPTMAPMKLRPCLFGDTVNRGSGVLLFQAIIGVRVIHNAYLSRESCVEGLSASRPMG